MNSHKNLLSPINSSHFIKESINNNLKNEVQKNFTITTHDSPRILVIKFNFERAVIENSSVFSEFVKDIIDRDYDHFILDLSDTLFLDSTFLGAIILFFKKVNLKGKTLKMVLNKEKLTIITIFDNLNKTLDIYNNLEEALSSIKESPK